METEKIKYKRVNKCCCCNRPTMLFVWSTSRNFVEYKEKLSNLLSHVQNTQPSKIIIEAVNFGLPVCFDCLEKIKKGGKIVGY
jgi:hypothetical protein